MCLLLENSAWHLFRKYATLSVQWLESWHLESLLRFQIYKMKFVGKMFNLALTQNIKSLSFNFQLQWIVLDIFSWTFEFVKTKFEKNKCILQLKLPGCAFNCYYKYSNNALLKLLVWHGLSLKIIVTRLFTHWSLTSI